MSDSPSGWLWPGGGDQRAELPALGPVLREFRKAHGLTQAALGKLLLVDQTYVSRIERGRRDIRDVDFLLRVARLLGIPPADVGLSNDLLAETASPDAREWRGRDGARLPGPVEAVMSGQSDWRAVRRYLNHHRSALARQAAGLYPAGVRLGRTALISPASWRPDGPVDLADISMAWVRDAPPPRVSGGEPETRALRPLRVPGRQFDRYTSAVRYLDPPRLFENRPSYRLLGLAWSGSTGAMRFGLGTYFGKLDISEQLAGRVVAQGLDSQSNADRGGSCRHFPGDPAWFPRYVSGRFVRENVGAVTKFDADACQ